MTFSGRSATQRSGGIQQERTSAAVPVTEDVLGHSDCKALYRELTTVLISATLSLNGANVEIDTSNTGCWLAHA